MTALLDIQDLHVGFNRPDGAPLEAVRGINLAIRPGESLAVVGESGSGKSVTALSVLRLLPYPTAFHAHGRIVFEGRDVLSMSDPDLRTLRRSDISIIFQEPSASLNPLKTIGDQVAEALDPAMREAGDLRSAVAELLEQVQIDRAGQRLGAFPYELSGGEQQRVMIAIAMAMRPKLLLADEPTTALDVTTEANIMSLLKTLQRDTGMAIMLITHDLRLAEDACDRVCVMHAGKIVETGPFETVLDTPREAYTRELVASALPEPRAPAETLSEPILAGDQLELSYSLSRNPFSGKRDRITALDHVSVELRRGETLGVVGESGAGKTSLAMTLLRLAGTDNDVLLDGERLPRKLPRRLRRRLQVVFQDPFRSLSPRLTVGDIVEEGVQSHFPQIRAEERRERAASILGEVGLGEDLMRCYPHELSGGQRQRVAIARAVIVDPDVLILDEPTSALDRTVERGLLDLLIKLQARRGLTYLLISHDLRIIRALSHRVAVMHRGRIVETQSASDLFEAPRQAYTRALLTAAGLAARPTNLEREPS